MGTIMRTCLCCCNVSAASLMIGMVWLIMASLMMVPLSSILSMVQFQGFMFQENLILFEEGHLGAGHHPAVCLPGVVDSRGGEGAVPDQEDRDEGAAGQEYQGEPGAPAQGGHSII